VAGQRQHVLHSRVFIERANGVLAERNRMSVERRSTLATTRPHHKLTEVTLVVVRGDIDQTLSRPVARHLTRTASPSIRYDTGAMQRAWICPDLAHPRRS